MEAIVKMIPVFGILALLFATYLARKVARQERDSRSDQ